MDDFLFLQMLCIAAPALLALFIAGVAAIVRPQQRRIAFRFDLTTLLLFFVAFGVVLMLTKAVEGGMGLPIDYFMICFFSMFTLPAVWLAQLALDQYRDQRRQRELRKAAQLQLGATVEREEDRPRPG